MPYQRTARDRTEVGEQAEHDPREVRVPDVGDDTEQDDAENPPGEVFPREQDLDGVRRCSVDGHVLDIQLEWG